MHLIKKNKTLLTYIIISIYFNYGIIIFSYALEVSGEMQQYPHLLGIAWPLHTLFAVSYYFYVTVLVSPGYSLQLKKIYGLYLLPGLLYALCLVPTMYIKSAADKMQYLTQYHDFDIISLFHVIFFNVPIIVFIILSFYKMRIFWDREKLKSSKFYRIIVILLVIQIFGVMFNCIGLIGENELMLRIDSMVFNIILFTPFLLGYRYPNFMHDLSLEISSQRYQQSQIEGLNVDAVISRLTDLLKIEKIYTDPELDINKLSERLEISKHQLSEILNDKLDINYWTYINTYRIEEAQRLLIENRDDSISKITYTVGFNSISTFYTAFTKYTAISPSEYRKNNL